MSIAGIRKKCIQNYKWKSNKNNMDRNFTDPQGHLDLQSQHGQGNDSWTTRKIKKLIQNKIQVHKIKLYTREPERSGNESGYCHSKYVVVIWLKQVFFVNKLRLNKFPAYKMPLFLFPDKFHIHMSCFYILTIQFSIL